MKEIYKNVFVGDQDDYEYNIKTQEGWSVVQACKEPYHRKALRYKKKTCRRNHPERLMAIRDNRLILNLIDSEDVQYVDYIIIDATLQYMLNGIENGDKVLIHCNKGNSRSATIGMLFLATKGEFKGLTFEQAESKYTLIYPPYKPRNGMREYAKINWDKYNNEGFHNKIDKNI